MVVDNLSTGDGCLAAALVRRILAADDESWLHEHAAGDRRLLRQFRATRRRSFYGCVELLHREMSSAQKAWASASERARDFGGADGPLEYMRFLGLLGMLIVTVEVRWATGRRWDGFLQDLVARIEAPTRFTSPASAAI